MALSLVPLSGILRNPDGTLANGTIEFELTAALVDSASGVLVDRGPIAVSIVNGAYNFSLYANDAVGVTPLGTLYKVTKKMIYGVTATMDVSYATVPTALAGGGGGLDDLVYVATGAAVDLLTHINDLTVHTTGRELGYAEVGSITSVAGASQVDVPGLATTVTCTGKTIGVDWGGFVYASIDNFTVYLDLWLDGVLAGRCGETRPVANGVGYSMGHKEFTPAAGAHTLKVRVYSFTGGGTGTALGATQYPLELLVVEHA